MDGLVKEHAKWLVTIVDRGNGDKVIELCKQKHIRLNFVMLGVGTARQDIVDYLGLAQTEKEIIFSVIPESYVRPMLAQLENKMQLRKPGKGISFSIPMSGLSAAISKKMVGGDSKTMQTDKEMLVGDMAGADDVRYELVVTVVNRGQSDVVMEAANQAGARGGTLMRAKGVGTDAIEKFFKVVIQPEKDVVLIIAERSKKQELMRGICNHVFEVTGEHAAAFSITIDDVSGIVKDKS